VSQRFTVKALGRQGDGVVDGPLYVSGALPGEVITGRIDGDRIKDMRIQTPSEHRVKPPCKHFKACGGCALQHGSDAFVADWKREIVLRALEQQGVQAEIIEHVETSPASARRRVKLTARRTKSGAIAGFMGQNSHDLVDVTNCVMLDARLKTAPNFARALARVGASRKSAIEVHVTAASAGMDVSVSGGKPLDTALQEALPALTMEHNCVRLTWNGELVAQSAPAEHLIAGTPISLPAGAFLQATDHGETSLQRLVRDMVQGAGQIADIFAGLGTFALSLADLAPIHGYEGEKPMLAALQKAANHAGLKFPIKAVQRDLFRDPLQPDELNKFDAVVLDPPRAGAVAQVAQLAKSKVAVIAYVSCEPVSFARDAAVLTGAGYVLDYVQVVDQFRWSTHVELAARFTASHMQQRT
jgi:23S rRNA (uracil1939-C5)-methyltransferase